MKVWPRALGLWLYGIVGGRPLGHQNPQPPQVVFSPGSFIFSDSDSDTGITNLPETAGASRDHGGENNESI